LFHARLDPDANHGVGVAFTDRHGGVSQGPLGTLNLGRADADDRVALRENLALVRASLGLTAIATVHQVHGTRVHEITAETLAALPHADPAGHESPDSLVGDALVTRMKGVGIAVRAADCLPILLADPTAGVVGAAHAGRQGLIDGVLQATLAAMADLGAADVEAWVGPSVCGRCYEVPAAMRAEVAAEIPETWAVSATGSPALDLAAGAHAVLVKQGCRVVDLGGCTRESADLHSYRRDGAEAGRLAGICWLG